MIAALFEQALRRHRAGDLDRAAADYRAVLAQDGCHGAAAVNLVSILLSRGRAAEARRAAERAVGLTPDDPHLRLALARAWLKLGDTLAALAQSRSAVLLAPGEPAFLLALGRGFGHLDRLDDAIVAFRRLGRLDPARGEAGTLAELLFRRGSRRHAGGDTDAAREAYRDALRADPHHVAATINLSTILRASGCPAAARDLAAAAVRRLPALAELRLSLGRALVALGDDIAAVAELRRAVALAPADPAALLALARSLDRLGRPAAAGVLRHVLRLDPANTEAGLRLAVALARQHRTGEARRVLAGIDPAEQALSPDYHGTLGSILSEEARNAEAVAAFERAIALEPDRASYYVVLGRSLQLTGRGRAAIGAMRRAGRLDPHDPTITSNLIVMRDFDPAASMADITAERRAWQSRHGAGLPAPAPHPNLPDPERRLRIGYVSSYFQVSSGAMIYAPIIAAQSADRFEVFCYSSSRRPDAVTARIRAATQWFEAGEVSDAALAARIRDDAIDILVDVDGHSPGNRLAVFARKPAPVQVTGWGHSGGTGLAAMDYTFVDPVFARPDEQPLFSERLVDLPCLLTIEPPDPAPAVVPAPVARNGFVTFGCFNRIAKVSPVVLGAWSRILAAVPASRLLLKGRMLDDPALRARVLDDLAENGIDPGRVLLRGGSTHYEHLEAHGEADIALDPFPMAGGVTTIEALWMGVPVVTFLGDAMFGRMGASILTALGEPQLIAASVDGYVALAVALAADRPALGRYRATLRDRLSGSPVGNPGLYTRYVEAAYRTMWRDWCRRAA